MPEAQTDDQHLKSVRTFLLVCTWFYLLIAILWVLFPDLYLKLVNFLSYYLTPGLPLMPIPESKYWLFLTFAMMICITACCYIASRDVKRHKHFMVPVMSTKVAAVTAATGYFIAGERYFAYLFMIAVDGFLFWITLYFYLKANREFFQEQTQYGRTAPEHVRSTGPATVVSLSGDDPFGLLDNILQESGFFDMLERRWRESGKSKERFAVVIKPNFMFMHSKHDPSSYTDPKLVEALIGRIAANGFPNIAIVESQSTYGNYYANRDVLSVARYIGYSTTKNYRIIDLTEEMVEYDYGGRLGKHYVGVTWRDADFRISFAKNKTHVFCHYTLTLKNIYGTLPVQNKLKEYHTKREYDWPTIETLKHFPVHFGLIDAIYSADGYFGVVVDPQPNHTKTMIGGENLIAVDWVGAKKMGLNPDDPKVGRFLPLAVEAFGKPEINWIGDQSVYTPWKNVHPVFVYALDLIEEVYGLSYWGFGCLSAADKYFTFLPKNPLIRLLRTILSPLRRRYFKHDVLD